MDTIMSPNSPRLAVMSSQLTDGGGEEDEDLRPDDTTLLSRNDGGDEEGAEVERRTRTRKRSVAAKAPPATPAWRCRCHSSRGLTKKSLFLLFGSIFISVCPRYLLICWSGYWHEEITGGVEAAARRCGRRSTAAHDGSGYLASRGGPGFSTWLFEIVKDRKIFPTQDLIVV
ncbi:Os03g0238000 [Oryza sativa Japonica Group]|uniref:Os03g0238000 protein n=2 Tax=Oryza sativa subsp. japonica TaxID=39947 RepID=Q0DTM6_ORYSJ|nr:hypothetical protein EE612_016380 [Oryza sativa]BAF11412.1 Os03g0238000 [Oryza sativa Japonica Group]BAS83170.1 Os03g0238000 [Oryza sativa Japonica Group]|eukprot:NP_001049498.1 Os03g0238000 [Oryza sativa Japonica Group]